MRRCRARAPFALTRATTEDDARNAHPTPETHPPRPGEARSQIFPPFPPSLVPRRPAPAMPLEPGDSPCMQAATRPPRRILYDDPAARRAPLCCRNERALEHGVIDLGGGVSRGFPPTHTRRPHCHALLSNCPNVCSSLEHGRSFICRRFRHPADQRTRLGPWAGPWPRPACPSQACSVGHRQTPAQLIWESWPWHGGGMNAR